MENKHDRFAPEGYVWVCLACGKISPNDRYGDKDSDPWWDESCMLNSGLFKESQLIKGESGRVVEIKEVDDEMS